ncbi:MAG TPA: PIG-L family deacetylase [Terriglobia bacterium]|nr:PIG-L family deacetylase [Terriglobia bacterium]
MKDPTRRNFLKDFGVGAAALSMPPAGATAQQMPGRPSSGDRESSASSTLMSIAAHPGDTFFAMGAPVAQHIQNGGRGVFLSLSLGEKGSGTIPPARYGPMQREASEHAAKMLGAQAVFLPYPDGEVPLNDEISFAVCDVIREFKPAIVVTHWRGSWHKDHRNCYAVVNDAIFYAALPAIVRKLPAHTVSQIYFAENWEDAKDFRADTYLDVNSACDRWLKACSFFPMWRGETGFRYDDYYRSLAIANGCLSGFNRAVALMSPEEQLTRRLRTL